MNNVLRLELIFDRVTPQTLYSREMTGALLSQSIFPYPVTDSSFPKVMTRPFLFVGVTKFPLRCYHYASALVCESSGPMILHAKTLFNLVAMV